MRPVILACFFLSGASGLVLEMLWTRMLTLVFGSTTLAVSTVLTAFMGGLGLGSYLAGRVADRLKNPARTYALTEAAIGCYALLVPVAMSFYPGLNRWLWSVFGDHYGLLSVLRFVASAGLLILPTTLMGATLPILARHFVRHPWELRRVGLKIGTLYSTNLFGAVAGAFLAGFVFLPSWGVRWTNVTAASFNLSLAAAILIARRLPRFANARASTGEAMDELLENAAADGQLGIADALPPVALVTPRARRVALAAFAVSGATAMTLQVLWTRALAVLIGSSVYSFTLILLAFLVGLGSGSALFGRLSQRTRHPIRWLAGLHLGIAGRDRVVVSGDRSPPVRLHVAPGIRQLRRRRGPDLSVRAGLHRRFAHDGADGGHLPADRAHRDGESGIRRQGHRECLRAEHRRRDRRIVFFGVRGAANAGPAARNLSRGGRRARSGGVVVQRGTRTAPSTSHDRHRHGRRDGGVGPRPSTLEPDAVFVRLLPRLDRARLHLSQDSQEGVAVPEAGVLRGRHRDHGLGRPVGQDAVAEEQRQGRRVQRRRHADADHRRPVAAAAVSRRASAEGRAHRLRLGRHRGRDHAVSDRVAGAGGTGARHSSARVAPVRQREPPPAGQSPR